MRDILIVLAKELREQIGDRQSYKGTLVQAGIIFVITGLVVPRDPFIWGDVRHLGLLYTVLPSAVGAIVAADAFAGERERRTLETLLATPLSERAIFFGKGAAALLFVMVVALSSFAMAMASAHRVPMPMSLASMLAVVVVGAFAVGAFTVSVALAISSRVRAARTAQQVSSMIMLFSAAIFGTLLDGKGPYAWLSLLQIDALVLALAIAVFSWAIRRFHRDRIFEEA